MVGLGGSIAAAARFQEAASIMGAACAAYAVNKTADVQAYVQQYNQQASVADGY